MGDDLRDQARIADDDGLLQLEVEYHVNYPSGEWLLEFFTRLLPGSYPVGRSEDLD